MPVALVRCVCKQTRAGTVLRGLRAHECLFSAWQGLLLLSQVGAVPRAGVSRWQLCPVPIPQLCPVLPPLAVWPQGRWPSRADPALTLLSLSGDNQDTCSCSGSAFPVSLRGPVQSTLPR